MKTLNKYRLADGSIYWHSLYYDVMPKFMTAHSLPGGSYNCAFYLIHPHKYLEDLFYTAKWFIQRGYRGYAECDVWSLDSYLCKWMPSALEDLRKNTHGHPIGMTKKGWNTRLTKMQRGFEEAKKISDMEYQTIAEIKAAERRMKHGLSFIVEHFLNLWD